MLMLRSEGRREARKKNPPKRVKSMGKFLEMGESLAHCKN